MDNKPTYEELERKVEELLKGNDEKFTQLIKNSFDMIVLLDSNGIQRYVSESCEKILGYKPEELINIPVIEAMLHPDDLGKARKGLKDIVDKKTNGGIQYRHRHKNGGWVYLEAFGTNQIDNPAIQSIVLNVRDITDRKLAEEALRESEARLIALNATKDRFFSIIGHDIKNPLGNILGFSNILLDQIHNQNFEGLEEYANIIQKASVRVMDLVTNLLEWSRTQTGQIKFIPEYFELEEAIDDATELLNDWAKQKSIHLHKELPQHLSLFADRAMINTILRNLISNGIKFTEKGGKIIISAENRDHQIIVSVRDNGIGIRKEDIEKLFRIEATYSIKGTQEETGTGLGLLICKEFIDLHGGKIRVESTVGKGSTFSFMLPQEGSGKADKQKG